MNCWQSGWWDYGIRAKRAERLLRYQWQKFLDRRDAEIESLGEIAALAQSVDNGAYSDERVLKTLAQTASQEPSPVTQSPGSASGH